MALVSCFASLFKKQNVLHLGTCSQLQAGVEVTHTAAHCLLPPKCVFVFFFSFIFFPFFSSVSFFFPPSTVVVWKTYRWIGLASRSKRHRAATTALSDSGIRYVQTLHNLLAASFQAEKGTFELNEANW